MAKHHIRDDYNHGRPSCDPHGLINSPLVVSVDDFIGRIASDQCQRCVKQRGGAIAMARQERARRIAYEAANAKYPLPISGKDD